MTHVSQIDELEQQLSALQQQLDTQAQQLSHRESEVSGLKAQLTTWRSVKEAEAASLAASNKQLTQQLAQEVGRSKTAEGQVLRLQAQLVRPTQQQPSG